MFEEQEALIVASAADFEKKQHETEFMKELAKQDSNLPEALIAYAKDHIEKIAESAYSVIRVERTVSGIEIDPGDLTQWLADYIQGAFQSINRSFRDIKAVSSSLN